MEVDVRFDLRSGTHGRDPDRFSSTLRGYHKLLWSKELLDGTLFELDDDVPEVSPRHVSHRGRFVLASNSMLPSVATWKAMAGVLRQLPSAGIESFRTLTYAIGGMIVFPGNCIDAHPTLNGAASYPGAQRLDRARTSATGRPPSSPWGVRSRCPAATASPPQRRWPA